MRNITRTNTAQITACTYLGNSHTPCALPTLEGKSYCQEHYAMVYKAGTARARRRKEERTVNKVRLIESLFNEAIEQLEAEGFDCYGDSELKSNRFESEEAVLG